MKKHLTLFVLLIVSVFAWAQSPKLSYQAVVRDSQNKLVVEQPVTVTVNVLDAANASLFTQTFNATTNRNGLISLEIGDETDAWKNLNWTDAKIRTSVVLSNGTEMVDTTNVNAVPFALYAEHVSDNFLSNYLDSAAVVRSIHDSLSVGTSAHHTHDNMATLNRTERAYHNADSTKLASIAEGAEVNVQADWNETSIESDAYIKNKPNIQTVPDNVSAFTNDAGYLTTDSTVITNMQENITNNANNIATNASNIATNTSNIANNANNITTNANAIAAAMDKEKADSTTLAARINALENASMDCNDVKSCIGDTLSKYTTTELLCNVFNTCDLSSNASIANLSTLLQGLSDQMEAMNEKMDSLNHLVDSLSNQAPVRSFICGNNTVDDHEGNTYNTVKIGNQCWTKENMRCTTSPSTGSTILDRQEEISYSGKKAYYYDNITSNAANGFGLLYNWCAAVDTFNTTMGETSTSNSHNDAPDITFTGKRRGICPQGWHVPSDADWTQLKEYLCTQSEYLCGTYPMDIAKSLASTEYWEIDSSHDCAVGNVLNENNKSGFSALPAGGRTDHSYDFRGSTAFFWSATQSNPVSAYYLSISYTGATAILNPYNKNFAHSVRCLRDGGVTGKAGDNEMQPSPTSTSCEDVMNCLGDTLGKLNEKIEAQGYTITELGNALDSLNHLVDSLSCQIPTPVYSSFTCGHYTVKDHEGNVYNTVRIGEQCWTKENMRCTTSPSTGTVILEHPASSYSYTGKKAYYPDSIAYNVTDYGLLYNWCATIDTFNTTYGETSTNTDFEQALQVTFSGNRRGICPQGWHVPSEAEWKQLRGYMVSHSQYWCNGDSTYIAKALASSTGWSANSNDCGVGNTQNNNNTSGFTALPAGFYTNGFPNFGYHAHFWSAKQSKASSAFLFQLDYYHPNVLYEDSGKDNGASVRCLRDGGITGKAGANEKQSSPTSMSCDDVMNCLGDTLGKLNAKINNLNIVVDGQNAIVAEQNNKIDSLCNVVDSLVNLIPFICGESKLRDIDGNEYSTILINGQCWMAENLRVTHRPNGQPLVNGTDSTNRENKRFYYKPTGIIKEMTPEQYVATYGLLYSYTAAVDSVVTNLNFPNSNCRGICPKGWHIPTYNEFTTISSNTDMIEIFNPSLAGYFNSTQNKFKSVGETAYYWSATPENETQANAWEGSRPDRQHGLSVRCLKD